MQKPVVALVALTCIAVVSWGQSSVLSTGSWHRLGIAQTGIYKLTYSDLQSLGIDPATLVPNDIQLYGNGGGELSQNSGDPRPIDLEEVAIRVTGAGDGSFDQGNEI